MIKRILVLLLIVFILPSCSKEAIPNWTFYYSYVNEDSNLGLYAKLAISSRASPNFLFSIERDESYYNDSCILVPNGDDRDLICVPVVDPNLIEFRLVYRPTDPKEDDILLIIGEEFLTDSYLFDESERDQYSPKTILGDVIHSIPFNRYFDLSSSFLEDLEFVVVVGGVEHLLFRGIATEAPRI